jgi:plasmid stabilization system protein ParE
VFPGLPYVAVYERQQDSIVVLRIIHGAMQWPPVA